MFRIMKYQLRNTRNIMLLILGAMALVHGITFVFELIHGFTNSESILSFTKFWMSLSMISITGVLFVQFFRCSSGHVEQLLYKDTNYLMLTIPRRGWEILGGRFLAGLIEYLIIIAGSIILLGIHVLILRTIRIGDSQEILQFIMMAMEALFANIVPVLKIILVLLCLYAMTGMSITFAVAASRSFIKKRGMASIVAVLGFIVLINAASKLGDVLNAALGWHTDPLFINDTMVSIPIPSFIVFALFAAVLFAASSWLIEKKVEV